MMYWDPYMSTQTTEDGGPINKPSSYKVLDSLDEVLKSDKFSFRVEDQKTKNRFLVKTILARDDL